jgi:hypothetical protein
MPTASPILRPIASILKRFLQQSPSGLVVIACMTHRVIFTRSAGADELC